MLSFEEFLTEANKIQKIVVISTSGSPYIVQSFPTGDEAEDFVADAKKDEKLEIFDLPAAKKKFGTKWSKMFKDFIDRTNF